MHNLGTCCSGLVFSAGNKQRKWSSDARILAWGLPEGCEGFSSFAFAQGKMKKKERQKARTTVKPAAARPPEAKKRKKIVVFLLQGDRPKKLKIQCKNKAINKVHEIKSCQKCYLCPLN